MRDTYATTQAVAVRRQTDTMRGVASLAKLIGEIGADPVRVTWEWWLSLSNNDPDDEHWPVVARQGWDKQFGGNVGDHLDPSVPAADLLALTELGAEVRHYVDKHVAHAEASAPTVTLTLDDIHDAVGAIGELFVKYANLLTGALWASLEPAIQHNWKAAFAVPWMAPHESEGSIHAGSS